MKYKKLFFYFLHFIILIYNTKKTLQTQNYIISNISNIFLQNYSSSISITTKELLFSKEEKIFSKYSYFLTTSKSGVISIISKNNDTFFSFEFKKKMYDTNIDQTNIINEDKVVLALEGKLFILKNNFEAQNFEEFTTPINELVDMTPFSLWFMPDYYFLSNKKYSIIKIVNNNDNDNSNNIDLNLIVFVDYTLICLKDKEQVWNTTITNVYFLGKNEENKINKKNIKIEELMLIYENNEILEKKIKNNFGNNNDLLFIHGYDSEKRKYIKIYDFNTFNHLVQNNSINNIEEQNSNNNIGSFEYKKNITKKYDHIDLLIYYSIIAFIILWIIILIFHSFIFKLFFSVSNFFKLINNKNNNNSENKTNNKINDNETQVKSNDLLNKENNNNNVENVENNDIDGLKNKNNYDTIFQKIQNCFNNNTDSKERKKTSDMENSIILELDINNNNNNNNNEENINKIENKRSNIFKTIKKNLNRIKIKSSSSNKNLKDYKNVKKIITNLKNFPINKHVSINVNVEEISPGQQSIYTNIKKDNYNNMKIKKGKSSPTVPLTRLEKDFRDITLIKKRKIGNNIGIILKAKHIIDEEIYAIKIKKLSNPNDEQIVINEAKNMTKIHSKHIVEYITCWFDKSLGKFEHLFEDENKNKDHDNMSDSTGKDEDIYSSSLKNNKTVFQEDEMNFKNQKSQEFKKDQKDDYVTQLYEKRFLSDDELINNKKIDNSFDKKFYPKKNINEENKKKSKINHDDSLIKSNISQKDIPNLNMYFFIQMEFCQGLTLSEYIKNHSKIGINNKILYTFTYQIIKSLARIHENKIVHRDINPDNIFIDNENSIKIGDFSSAKEIQSSKFKKKSTKNSQLQMSLSTGKLEQEENNSNDEKDLDKENWGSSIYWSPEQEQGIPADQKSDIYSVGLVLYIMCECLGSEKERKKSIIRLKNKNIISDKVKNLYNLQYKLILKMIEYEPECRPNCNQLLDSDEMKQWKNMTDD